LQTLQPPTGAGTKKKSSGDVADKISGLWVNARLFEKGLKLFDGTHYIFLVFQLLIFLALFISSARLAVATKASSVTRSLELRYVDFG